MSRMPVCARVCCKDLFHFRHLLNHHRNEVCGIECFNQNFQFDKEYQRTIPLLDSFNKTNIFC
ncbi:hypothetical protein LEP1GSC039_1108 [Leptospira santarosai str. 2000027870]|nr:hypothetical protein LEP1GSC039_1108 [Leptospira santarosai str. 2000027870]